MMLRILKLLRVVLRMLYLKLMKKADWGVRTKRKPKPV